MADARPSDDDDDAAADDDDDDDAADAGIPGDEEELLARVRTALAARASGTAGAPGRQVAGGTSPLYDKDLIALRDEIAEARLEDVPALWAQMERLQGVSLRRAEAQGMLVDPASPYFGHLRLREQREEGKERERGREARAPRAAFSGRRAPRAPVCKDVLIGRASFVDPVARVNIVDWRDAPVSQLYYRYEEGSDYEERFGEREVTGEILARRTVTIEHGELLRIACPQGVWQRAAASSGDGWTRFENPTIELTGGEGTAARPTATGSWPAGNAAIADPADPADRADHVDPAEPAHGVAGRARGRGLGTRPTRERRRASAQLEGSAPGLGAAGRLAPAQRLDRHLPEIAALIDPRQFEIITARRSGVVVIQGGAGSGKTTVGLHRIAYLAFAHPQHFPAQRILVVTYGSALAAYIGKVLPSLGVDGVAVQTFEQWATRELRRAIPWLRVTIVDEAPPAVARVKCHPALLGELERRARAHVGKRHGRAILELWAELLTDLPWLKANVVGDPHAPLRPGDVVDAHRMIAEQVSAFMDREPRVRLDPRRAREKPPDDDDVRGDTGIDGLGTAVEMPPLDLQDAAILIRAHQLVRGPRKPLAHLFVDEAQDLSPVELSALIGQTTSQRSVTLAGDTAQRLFLDNGFADWRTVLGQLSLDHVAVEPLRVAYRSTRQIFELARHAMGPLADAATTQAPRSGAPVEALRFPGTGAAVAFVAEALRALLGREPRATVAVLARHPEQADRWFDGLHRAEVPSLRRVRGQDFAFHPGVEVTDVRQVKGLEFDYVVLCEVNANIYGTDDESRHLLHIGATRAAHQLWLIVTAAPSPLLPPGLLGVSRRKDRPT